MPPQPASDPPRLTPHLEALRAISFVRRAQLLPPTPTAAARLRLTTSAGRIDLDLLEERSHLTHATADRIATRPPAGARARILLAPYVGPDLARLFIERHLNFVDAAGNVFLRLGPTMEASHTGRRPVASAAADKALRAPGYQALFALLADTAALEAPVRTVALRAGVSKSTVAQLLTRLTETGRITTDGGARRWLGLGAALRDLLAGWEHVLRPALSLGRFQPPVRTPPEVEAFLERTLVGQPWALGGTAGAYRLAPHHRGDHTVVHVESARWRPLGQVGAARALGAVARRDGSLELLATPGPVGFEGPEPHVAHPLLVYLELATSRDERTREGADELLVRHLPGLAR